MITSEAPGREVAAVGRRPDVIGLSVALVAAALLLVLAWPRVTAPFGDSDEGINAAVWATGSRALREEGIVDSRLGGRRQDGTSYATHPPLLVVATAVAESVAGERPSATRAPAWLGSLAAVGLLYALARSLRVGPAPAAAAAVAVATTPMFATYGVMLDTPVVSLPFGVAVLLLWHRRWRAAAGERADHPALVAAVAAVAALSGWQATVLVGLVSVVLVVRGVRRGGKGWWREAAPFALGGATGLLLSLGWTWWVYGDFATLGDKFFRRSGESNTVGVDDMVSFQIPWLVQLLGLGVIGLGACVGALWDRRARPLAAMSLGIVVLYAVVFRQAAAGHQYWNYWALVPTAVGFAWAFDRLAADLSRRALAPALAVVCAALAVGNLLVLPNDARDYVEQGQEVAELVDATTFPEDQPTVPYVGQAYRPDAWITYATGRPARALQTPEDVRAWAAERGDDRVVVLGWCEAPDPGYELCRAIVGDAGEETSTRAPRVVTVGELAQQLPG